MRTEPLDVICDWARLEGWRNLSGCLTGIGIPKSVAALESLHRRHNLPHHGGGVQGKLIWFTREDQSGWVRFLTGVDLDTWLLQIQKDRAAGVEGELDRVRPAARSTTDINLLLAPLIVITIRPLVGAETVYRLDYGLALASTNTSVAEEWGFDAPPASSMRVWRYRTCRPAKDTQLRRPRLRHRQRRSREATTLLAAVEIEGSSAKLCRVPGEVFGLAEGTKTALVVSRNELRFDEVIEHGRQNYPNAVWLAWSRRRPLRLITLEEDLPDEDDSIPGILD